MSARIAVKYWGDMMELCGKKEEEITAGTVEEVLTYIKEQYGKAALKGAKRMIIAVNGTNIQLLDRYKTSLAEGDKVSFLPLSGGG